MIDLKHERCRVCYGELASKDDAAQCTKCGTSHRWELRAQVAPAADVETFNWAIVGGIGDDIAMMRPKAQMTRDEALVLAAYLVALADTTPDSTRFEAVYKAVISV